MTFRTIRFETPSLAWECEVSREVRTKENARRKDEGYEADAVLLRIDKIGDNAPEWFHGVVRSCGETLWIQPFGSEWLCVIERDEIPVTVIKGE